MAFVLYWFLYSYLIQHVPLGIAEATKRMEVTKSGDFYSTRSKFNSQMLILLGLK